MQRQRRGERRREQRPVAIERRSGEERRTGIEVREISAEQAPRVLARELKETALTPLEQALFELVHAYGAAWAAQAAGPARPPRRGPTSHRARSTALAP